jgi:hypothetical protein
MRSQRIAVVAALAPLALASTACGSPASCVPAKAKTLRASGAARIFSQGYTLYGCLGARTTRLGSLRGTVPFPARRITLYALSPRYAALDDVDMGVDTFASTVTLIDLRSGRTIATSPATTPERAPESFVTVTAIRVGATGTLAWIGERTAIGMPQQIFEVHALAAGKNRLLASATDVAPKSLRLRENIVSWQAGGHSMSATL